MQDFRDAVLWASAPSAQLLAMYMSAAVYETYGGPEVVSARAVPRPEPREDEVRVAVAASTVTAACGMMRRGDTVMARVVLGLMRPRRRFRVLGTEIAGVIDAVGARVRRFQVGDRVYGFTGMRAGGCAEYVTLREDASLVAAPRSVTLEEACTFIDGPITALYLLRERGALWGERVTILGASGSVGSAAVQLVRHLSVAQIRGLIGRALPIHPHLSVIAATWQLPVRGGTRPSGDASLAEELHQLYFFGYVAGEARHFTREECTSLTGLVRCLEEESSRVPGAFTRRCSPRSFSPFTMLFRQRTGCSPGEWGRAQRSSVRAPALVLGESQGALLDPVAEGVTSMPLG